MESENFIGSVHGETIKAKNFFKRLAGVFFSPKKTFSEIGRAPRLLTPVIAVMLTGAAGMLYISVKVDTSVIIAKRYEGLTEGMTTEQLAAIEQSRGFIYSPIPGAVGGGITALIICLVISGYGKIFSMIAGAKNQYKILLEVSLYTMIAVGVVSAVLGVIVLQIKAPWSAVAYEMPDIVYHGPNLGALIETVAGNVLPKFIIYLTYAGDIFNILIIVLLSIGFAAVSTKLKTSTAAMWLGGIYMIRYIISAVIITVFGAVFGA